MLETCDRRKILIVDDDTSNIRILVELLREQYDISIAKSGLQALELAKQIPDLILLDVLMPDMDGYEVFKQLKQQENTKDITTIFVTAKNSVEQETHGLQLGAADYITKPFSPLIVKARVAHQIEIRKQQEEIITSKKQKVELDALKIKEKGERQVMMAQKEAIKAFESNLKLKNDFLTAISHELRTPMNAIFGGLQVMSQNSTNSGSSPLDIIHAGASEMMHLVDDILIHTEIQSGRFSITPNNIQTKDFFSSILNKCQLLCDRKDLALEWRADQRIPDWILTDEDKLTTIFDKLLDNAIKFTASGSISCTIEFDDSTLPPNLTFSISDTGIGIEESQQETIFEAFTQSESGFQRRFGGLGVGLSICRKLIEIQGGTIQLKSTSEEGSCFTASIPVEIGYKPYTEETLKRTSPLLPILIVEDNLVNQKIMKKFLEKSGYQSLIANHGKEALDILEKDEVSLILMDLQMPVMDGFSCTKHIRNHNLKISEIPIIAVTANLMDADIGRCKDFGMNGFIQKPVKIDKLLNYLHKYIEPATTIQ